MSATERARRLEQAKALRTAWARQLEREFGHHSDPTGYMDGETLIEALMARLSVPVIDTPPEHTWIWSDLHVRDSSARTRWNRAFLSVKRMNAYLLGKWERVVKPEDTIICLGDVAVTAAWRNSSLIDRLRRCPGKRWLVLGNHNAHHTRELRDVGFDAVCAAAVYAAGPRSRSRTHRWARSRRER
ncbi:MAG: hypothetical protein OXH52_06075 [Gammaproteobacteria bacterium]|nr:hypothetical protein [Gammaproteobacteria bacterium]